MNESASNNTAESNQVKSITRHISLALTNGGRSLNAIWYLKIPPTQKLILQFFGSEMNFTEDFTETIRISRSTLAQFICVSVKTLNIAINALIESGYIKKTIHVDVHECNEASEYGLTEKLWDDYAQFLEQRYVQRSVSLKAANYKRSKGMIGDKPNEGGGVDLNPGGGVDLNPLFSPSFSSPEIPNPRSKTKTEETQPQSGGEISLTSIAPIEPVKNAIPPPPLGKRDYSSAELAVVYAKSMEFLYSKRGKHYDWDTANLAAENFICEHSLKSAEIVRNWALDRRDLHGMLKVKDDMFEFLWARFIDDTMGGNLS